MQIKYYIVRQCAQRKESGNWSKWSERSKSWKIDKKSPIKQVCSSKYFCANPSQTYSIIFTFSFRKVPMHTQQKHFWTQKASANFFKTSLQIRRDVFGHLGTDSRSLLLVVSICTIFLDLIQDIHPHLRGGACLPTSRRVHIWVSNQLCIFMFCHNSSWCLLGKTLNMGGPRWLLPRLCIEHGLVGVVGACFSW